MAGGERTQTRRPRGRNDPNRAERIIDAAIDVIVKAGLEGLSHRAIAAEAGVPLGSTTYYFETLDDIVVAATQKAIERDAAVLEEWAAGIDRNALVVALSDRIFDEASHRERSIAYYRLYLGAAARPELQDLAFKWACVMTGILEKFVDEETAEALSTVYDALVMRVLIMGGRVTKRDVERIIRVVAEGPPGSSGSPPGTGDRGPGG